MGSFTILLIGLTAGTNLSMQARAASLRDTASATRPAASQPASPAPVVAGRTESPAAPVPRQSAVSEKGHTTEPVSAAAGPSTALPDWVVQGDQNRPPVRLRVVSSELWATREQATRDAIAQAGDMVIDYTAQADPRVRADWSVPRLLIYDRLVREEFLEPVEKPYGRMYRTHLLLELSPEKRGAVLTAWREAMAARRLRWLAGGLGLVFVCLSSLFAYLKLDDATRGFYTNWLRLGAAGTVSATAAALYYLLV